MDVYKAEGDPWTYLIEGDKVVVFDDSGQPQKVTPGSAAHQAILGQIESGQLQMQDAPEVDSLPGAAPEPDADAGLPNMKSGGIGDQPFDETADAATADYTRQKMREARGYDEKRNSIIERLLGGAEELIPTPLKEARERRATSEADQLAEDVTETADKATDAYTRKKIAEKRAAK